MVQGQLYHKIGNYCLVHHGTCKIPWFCIREATTTSQTNALFSARHQTITFYKDHCQRTGYAFILAFSNWVLGAAEIFITMHFLGYPVSLVHAWIIESIAQLVRTATFFIPASIGAQEGAFLIIGTAVTGSPTVGFTMAIVRRAREIIWVTWGLLVFYTIKGDTKTLGKK